MILQPDVARMKVKFMTSVDAIVMEGYVKKQKDKKNRILQKNALSWQQFCKILYAE